MSKAKQYKLKKIHKGHIAASLFFLLCSIACAICVVAFAGRKIFGYSVKDRVRAFYNTAIYVSRMFEESSSNAEDLKIIEYLKNNPELAEAVYLIDGDKNIGAGFGGATFDLGMENNLDAVTIHKLEKDLNLKFDRQFSICFDKSSDETIKNIVNKGIVFGFESVEHEALDSEIVYDALNKIVTSQKEVFYEAPIWIGVPVSDSKTVMVKNKLTFYFEDLFFIGIISLITLVMFIPTMFLFIIVISNTVNGTKITKLLYTDPITLGNNWQFFEEYATKVLSAGRNAGKHFAIVDFTIMKYGSFCTYHGVKGGEALLKETDRQLSKLLGRLECAARYGKSSFALLLKYENRDDCEKRMTRLIGEIGKNLGHESLSFHAGIYFIGPARDDKGKIIRRKNINVAELYNSAANARSAITDDNNSTFITFDKKLREEQIWEHKVEEKMQSALENEEFKVYIQPKYNPVNEELSGAEALVRWINDEDGFVSPGKFIPLFEKNGFITKLDDYMIAHVSKMQADWLAQGKELVPISVNVSRAHFADPNLAEHICKIVDEYNVPHHFIEIELTESAFFDDKDALLNTVRKLKDMGFDISMDDFGAGYSSLNSLKDLPLDVLKLDAEFFRGENNVEGRGEIVVSQAIQLAKELNMRIVAEGVEKKDQVDFLAAHDCDMIQGFYFAKPMPASEYEMRLKTKA